jgi:hypothetical protein
MRQKPQPDLRPFLDGPLYIDLVLPLLLAAMTTAVFTGAVVFMRQSGDDNPWNWLYPAVFFIALETVYTNRWLNLPGQRLLNKIGYRLAEFMVIALVLRLLSWALFGGFPSLAQWRGYLLAPGDFIDPVYFVFLLFAAMTMAYAGRLANTFHWLALSQSEISYFTMSEQARLMSGSERPPLTNRAALRERFFQDWLVGGFFVGLFAAFTAFDLLVPNLSLRTVTRLGLQPEMLLALLVYFLIGFWLVSHARLAAMRARWLAEGVTPDESVAWNWRRNSLLLVTAVAFLASLLPIGDSSGLGRMVETIFIPLNYLASGAISLLLLLLAGLFGLFGRSAEPAEDLVTPEAPIPPEAPPVFGEPVPMGETPALILGTIFWTIMAVAAVAAVLFFLHNRGYRLNRPGARRLWRDVRRWLATLWRDIAAGATAVRETIQERFSRERPSTPPSAPTRFVRLNALSPREKARYFYLSTARRASEKGVPRAPAETPLEYARDLETTWPDAREDIETLTTAFLEARYGRDSIPPEAVNPIQAAWRRVRAALKRSAE